MKIRFRTFPCFGFLMLAAFFCLKALAEDWPMYGHDAARSGVSSEQLTMPLHETWRYKTPNPPKPAWPAPAENDYWHNHRNLRATVTYDRVYHTVSVGDSVFFASSSNDKVYALDAKTGKEKWSFFTEGPIRLAPTIENGRLYVGSDDGVLYCLNASSGELLWRFRTEETDSRLPGNGRMISRWPIRSGIVVDNGEVFFTAGMFPNEGVYLFAISSNDGSLAWKQKIDCSAQGYMAATAKQLIIPTGQTNPIVFDRTDGRRLGEFPSGGGAYALLSDDIFITGPGRGEKQLTVSDSTTKESIAAFGGLRILVDGPVAYLQSEASLSAFNRQRYFELSRQTKKVEAKKADLEKQIKSIDRNSQEANAILEDLRQTMIRLGELKNRQEECFLWKIDFPFPYALILAKNLLFAGGENRAAAIDVNNGEIIWDAPIDGTAYGLSVAGGRLFVSTDRGVIHCFSNQKSSESDPPIESPAYPQSGKKEFYRKAAQHIIDQTGITQGYGLVLGSQDGFLAYELAQLTDLYIIGVEENPQKVQQAREWLDREGLYGSRITIHQRSFESLPYPDYFANLIVSDQTLSDGNLPPSLMEAYRVLRPEGGKIFIGQMNTTPPPQGVLTKNVLQERLRALFIPNSQIFEKEGIWAIVVKGTLNGSDEWTQLYSNPSHTASNSELIEGPVHLQWFGEPGPKQIIDRHHRPMSPLYKNGRLFIPANNQIVAVDAYNGSRLWKLDVPDSRRIGVMKNCGQMLAANDLVYIAAKDECWGIDAATGEKKIVLKTPPIEKTPHDWGYLNQIGERLYGSAQKAGASFSDIDFDGSPLNGSYILEGDFREVIISNFLFSIDRYKQDVKWTYQNGAVMNSAMAIGDERIYFAECRNPQIMNDEDGRIRIDRFCEKDLYLTALDLHTGEKLWEQPLQLPFEHIMYLNYAGDTVLLTGTYNLEKHVHYGLFAFHADTGKAKWQTSYLGMNINGDKPFGTEGSHGEQWQHPIIQGRTIYSKPYAFDLHTGEKLPYIFYRGGHGCGGFTCSAHYLYGRGSNPRMYPRNENGTSGIQLTQVSRPGCWLNIIPAGGMILLPESSSGCTCSYSVQTSLAFTSQEFYSPPLFLILEREFTDSLQVELADRNGFGEIRYTLDGSDPSPSSPLYNGSFTIDQTTAVKARTFWGETRSSGASQAVFKKKSF
ncbi:MAG: PQQ-binding-like beta-propeller repeat protein [Candidatus Omnitrophica bacterium]|nr:PQQ-binding-like beta-propeller repeat protein [Candidatus Omnitrophota bacterium]